MLLLQIGRKGIFTFVHEAVGKTLTPLWIPRNPKESHEEYRGRIDKLAAKRNQGVLFRKGYGADLGFALRRSDPTVHRALTVEAQGFSRSWHEEILEFFQNQKWQQLNVLTRKNNKHNTVWIVQGTPDMQEQGRRSLRCYSA